MKRFENIGLKNKILFSIFAVILLLSVGIYFPSRLLLVSSLTSELKLRGIAIAESVADRGREYILTRDKSNLVSLVFDAARLGERKLLISYIFVLDNDGNVLSHNFTDVFPRELGKANRIPSDEPYSIKLLRVNNNSSYDIAMPVREGIYQIGTVRVGLDKKHIDHLIGKLGIAYLSIVSAIIIIFFVISHWLSKYISLPISNLTKVSDEISRGNLDIKPDFGSKIKCWELKTCNKEDCPAYHSTEIPCWYVDETQCEEIDSNKFSDKIEFCRECNVYKRGVRDEVRQLADSFVNMTNKLKASQAMLKESEKKYRSLFDSGPNPIFVLDRGTLEILDANPSALVTYGYSKEELIGRSSVDLGIFEGDKKGLSPIMMDNGYNSFISYSKIRHFKKGNKPFYVNLRACPSKYQKRDAMIVGTTDITEMIEKDSQLIHASKMSSLGEMSAGIAHELNQPLNAIKMGSEFLKMMRERSKKVRDHELLLVINEISDQVDRAAEIITHLRDFGRKADFAKEEININKPIRGVLDIVRKPLSLQNIFVEVDLDENIPPILAHNNRLEQVIFNLVTNARDSINQKQEVGNESGDGIIRIRSYKEGDLVAVTVSDTGIGIPESERKRIFDAFYTTKEMGEGMGLGLSISYGIVRDYDGDIHLESEVGRGATFKLTFPHASE